MGLSRGAPFKLLVLGIGLGASFDADTALDIEIVGKRGAAAAAGGRGGGGGGGGESLSSFSLLAERTLRHLKSLCRSNGALKPPPI